MAKKYPIELRAAERMQLQDMVCKGKRSVREVTRAKILLLADDQYTDEEIVADLEVGIRTIERIRARYVQEGLAHALFDASRPGQPRRLDLIQEGHLIALACTTPPRGHKHWTIELLTERLLQDKVVASVGRETVRRILQSNGLKPWGEKKVVYPEADRGVQNTHGRYIDRL